MPTGFITESCISKAKHVVCEVELVILYPIFNTAKVQVVRNYTNYFTCQSLDLDYFHCSLLVDRLPLNRFQDF